MFFLKQILIGVIVGGGMILPGVSGGVLAVIFGIYEKTLDSIANFFKDIKKNSTFLGPLVLGVILGIVMIGKVLYFIFDKYWVEASYVFMGLILGGVPVLFREIKNKNNSKFKPWPFIIAFLVSLALFVLGKDTLNINFANKLNNGFISIIILFITGFIYITGKIVPGISSSFMLMLIGMYQFLLNVLNDPLGLSKNEYMQLIPFVLGMIVGAIYVIKFIRYVLRKYHSHTYSCIIGFVIGSIAAIYPGFNFDYQSYLGLLFFVISFFASYKFSTSTYKSSKKH